MVNAYAWLGCATLALSSLGLGGCGAIAGDQQAGVTFSVHPRPDGTFAYDNTLTVDIGSASVTDARLLSVTLDTEEPAGTPDLTYMTAVVGTGVAPDGTLQTFCTASRFPAGEESTTADVAFDGNIVPFFDSTNTLHIVWNGTINPAYTFPADGFRVRAQMQVEPQ